jgi:hypothetical protein
MFRARIGFQANKRSVLNRLSTFRPRQNNFALELKDPLLRERVEKVARDLLEKI